MKAIAVVGSIMKYFLLIVVTTIVLSLVWLRWESSQPREQWFVERQGQIESVATEQSFTQHGDIAESVQLVSDTGLKVFFQTVRDAESDGPVPILLIIGGHRTGSDAVKLFGEVSNRAIVGVDYPYDGPESVKGVIPILKTIPSARQGLLDITPAVSLILDWLVDQPWVDQQRIIIVGGSLGVPFAAAVAARDERISALMLVHGAADNRLWLEVQVARRIDFKFVHYPLSTILNWLAYGPVFDTGKHVASVSPRPVLIIAARDDERTPAGQAEILFDAAGEPKRLLFTEGKHVQPNRSEIVDELLRITDEELPFLIP